MHAKIIHKKFGKDHLKNYDVNILHDLLQKTHWDNNIPNVNNLANIFTSTITNALDEICPKLNLRYLKNMQHIMDKSGDNKHDEGERQQI